MEVIIYRNIRRDCFEKLSSKVVCGTKYFGKVVLRYNGTNMRGDLKIEIKAGETEIYKEFIIITANTISDEM